MRLLLNTADQSDDRPDLAFARYMMRIHLLMGGAFVMTAGAATLVTTQSALRDLLYKPPGFTAFGWVALLAPLLLVIAISGLVHRIAAPTARILFIGYATLMGLSTGLLVLGATGENIGVTFLATAGAYGMMALIGWTGRTEFSPLASFLLLSIFGIALLMMLKAGSEEFGLDIVFSTAAIILISVLTALDVQRLRRLYIGGEVQTASVGALTLYLDFIDMFLAMFRFNRRQKSGQ